MRHGNEAPVIDVKGVHKSFKTVHAVKGIDLRIYEGQFVALLGPNGAGKTTLVEMIEGIQHPDDGEIRILNKHWEGHSDELHREIGISLQETRYIDKLTLRETLRLFASFYSLNNERVEEIINMIDLKDKARSYVVNLSGGQRQKLALGIALLNNPQILLLDEPTTGLDPNARREIWSLLLKLKKEARTSMILTTHYMEEAEFLCDYIVIMDQGNILKEGTKADLLDEDHDNKMIEFTIDNNGISDDLSSEQAPFPIEWDPEKQKAQVAMTRMENELPRLLSFLKEKNLQLKNLECRRKTLDDLFTSLTGRHLHE